MRRSAATSRTRWWSLRSWVSNSSVGRLARQQPEPRILARLNWGLSEIVEEVLHCRRTDAGKTQEPCRQMCRRVCEVPVYLRWSHFRSITNTFFISDLEMVFLSEVMPSCSAWISEAALDLKKK